jgi:uncharacterized protein (DUF488 family)
MKMANPDIVVERRSGQKPHIIYTIGYEGRSQDDFSNELKSNGITRLIDVREVARSRKPGFSSKRMSDRLTAEGVEYLHFQSLGSPRSLREELKNTGDFGKFINAYRRHLGMKAESIEELRKNAIEMPTAIMCFERNPTECHRSIIASELEKSGFTVVNL